MKESEMTYRQVHDEIWTDEKTSLLLPGAHHVFLYLITNAHGNLSGLYLIPPKIISQETRYSTKKVIILLKSLVKSGLINYDWDTNLVLVKGMLKYQKRNKEAIFHAYKRMMEFPNHLFSKELQSLYEELNPELNPELKAWLNGSLSKKLEVRSKKLEVKRTPLPPKGESSPLGDGESLGKIKKAGHIFKHRSADTFFNDQFWPTYPRHEDKKKAASAMDNLNPGDEMKADIMRGLMAQVKSEQWGKDNGQFIPHPTTYINGARWEDEFTSKRAQAIEDEDRLTEAEIEQLKKEGYM